MTLRLGDYAPDFTANSTEGWIAFHDYLGDGWGILLSHPGDFTPVSTTELGEVSRLIGEFERRDTKVVGVSVDSVTSHPDWADDIKEATVWIDGLDRIPRVYTKMAAMPQSQIFR